MNTKSKSKNILTTFSKYVSLNVLGMIGLSCYILADTFFISKGLGVNGLTALNLAIPIYSFISGLGLMIGMGGATRYSILKGSQKRNDMNEVYTHSVIMGFGVSLIFLLMGILFASPLSTLLGADEAVHGLTKVYLRTIMTFAPMFIINNVLLSFVRNDGDPSLSMVAMLTGSFSNIILDYIFIFPLKMGMFGAALATGVAPIISMFILSIHFIRKRNHFKLTKIKLKFDSIKDISALGSSALITEISSGIVMLIFNMIILKIEGNIGVAAYGIIANIALVIIALFTGISQGIQPIISHNHGMGEKENVTKIYIYGIITAVVSAVLIYGITYYFSEPIVNIFNKDKDGYLSLLAVRGMRLYFIGFFFAGLNIVSATYFSSTDQPIKSFMISIIRGFIAIIPLAFLLSHWFGMTGVWITLTCAELVTTVYIGILFKKEDKNLSREYDFV